MSIVAFWSKEKKETGQTLSTVALSTYMAIEHNYRILTISTSFDDSSLEDCYWPANKAPIIKNGKQDALSSGVEGLVKIINSNKTTNSIISTYSRIVYKDRLDILCSSKTKEYKEYLEIASKYKEIIQTADKVYDFVFIDLSKDMPEEDTKRILEMADVIVTNICPRYKVIDDLYRLKAENDFFNKTGIMVNIGRYDGNSKYNVKNVTRFLREKKPVYCVPYNTLFLEACSEGKMGEFFLKYRRLDPSDINALLVSEVDRFAKALIYKIQELQVERTRVRRN